MDSAVIPMLTVVAQVVFLEGVLSIDNVAVLGAMASKLPNKRLHIPIVKRYIPIMDGLSQRKAALEIGLVGAYVGRGLMLLMASFIVRHRVLQLVGAVYLLILVWDHFVTEWKFEPSHLVARLVGFRAHHKVVTSNKHPSFWATSLAIELTDLAFSLDNVVAAVSLSKNLVVVGLGVAIGMLLMRFFAGEFVKLVKWEPALNDGAYALLLIISVKLVVAYIWEIEIAEFTQFMASLLVLVGVVMIARLRRRGAGEVKVRK